jgi:4-carboxymuconolactone decarboxylase
VVEAIRDGEPPPFSDPDEPTVVAVTDELVTTGSVSEQLYRQATERLGTRAVVDLVMLVGYYSLVSFTLSAFAVPLPPRSEPVFQGPPEHPGRTPGVGR